MAMTKDNDSGISPQMENAKANNAGLSYGDQQFLEDVLLPRFRNELDKQTDAIVASLQQRTANLLEHALSKHHLNSSNEPLTYPSKNESLTSPMPATSSEMEAAPDSFEDTIFGQSSLVVEDERSGSLPKGSSAPSSLKYRQSVAKGAIETIASVLTISEVEHPGHHQKYVRSRLFYIVHSTHCRIVISLLIVANSILIGLQTEDEVAVAISGGDGGSRFWSDAELVFTAAFTLEVILRAWVDGCHFYKGDLGRWNLFDLLLVVQAWFSLIGELTVEGELPNLTFTRLLRLLRFSRFLRMLRVLRFFRSLRLIMLSMFDSLLSLLWTFMLLALVIYFFAVIVLHCILNHIKDDERLLEYFNSIQKACLSLFMAITGGMDWTDLYAPLADADDMYGLVFIFYIYFALFGVLNTVTSMFVDSVQTAALSDHVYVVQLQTARRKTYVKMCREFFRDADTSGEGALTWEDLDAHLQVPHNRDHLSTLELDETQARALYNLADTEGTNCVTIDDFVDVCENNKGNAKAIDLHMLHCKFQTMVEYIHSKLERIEAQAGRSRTFSHAPSEEQTDVNISEDLLPSARKESPEAAMGSYFRMSPEDQSDALSVGPRQGLAL